MDLWIFWVKYIGGGLKYDEEFYPFQPTHLQHVQIHHFFDYWCDYPLWHDGKNNL